MVSRPTRILTSSDDAILRNSRQLAMPMCYGYSSSAHEILSSKEPVGTALLAMLLVARVGGDGMRVSYFLCVLNASQERKSSFEQEKRQERRFEFCADFTCRGRVKLEVSCEASIVGFHASDRFGLGKHVIEDENQDFVFYLPSKLFVHENDSLNSLRHL